MDWQTAGRAVRFRKQRGERVNARAEERHHQTGAAYGEAAGALSLLHIARSRITEGKRMGKTDEMQNC